jgi:hypothetical protein
VSKEEAASNNPPTGVGKTMGDEPWTVQPTSESGDGSVPPDVLAAAYRALESRPAGAVLSLVFDSLLGERRSALGGTRQLRFGGDDPHVEVAFHESGQQLDADITIVPPRATTLSLRHGGGTTTVATDAYGRGSASIGHGPMSVVYEGADGDVLETAWVNV